MKVGIEYFNRNLEQTNLKCFAQVLSLVIEPYLTKSSDTYKETRLESGADKMKPITRDDDDGDDDDDDDDDDGYLNKAWIRQLYNSFFSMCWIKLRVLHCGSCWRVVHTHIPSCLQLRVS